MRIRTILDKVLSPIGFRRKGSSWTKYSPPIFVRVSYYASSWGAEANIDLALTVSDFDLMDQKKGDWHTLERIHHLIPSGSSIVGLLKPELSPEEAGILKRVLEEEAVPLIERIGRVDEANKIVRIHRGWLAGERFLQRLEPYTK